MILAFSSLAGYGLVSPNVLIYLCFDSWEPSVWQNIVVYGKGAKKEANVISYFLMTSEWHPCIYIFSLLCGEAVKSPNVSPLEGDYTIDNFTYRAWVLSLFNTFIYLSLYITLKRPKIQPLWFRFAMVLVLTFNVFHL